MSNEKSAEESFAEESFSCVTWEGRERICIVGGEGAVGIILQEIGTVSWTFCSKFSGASKRNKEFWMTVWSFQKMKAFVFSFNI